MQIKKADQSDLSSILDVQKIAFQREALRYHDFNIHPLKETMEEIEIDFQSKIILIAKIDERIVGSIRGQQLDESCEISRLSVLPNYQGRGIASKLLKEMEHYFTNASKFVLGTGAKSSDNIQLYQKIGYNISHYDTFHDGVSAVFMIKMKNKK